MEIRENNFAILVVGKRDVENIEQPFELGYICPTCKNKHLQWSEYNTFLYCGKCNLDIPSCFCKKNIKEGIEIYLKSVNTFKSKLPEQQKESDNRIALFEKSFYQKSDGFYLT